MSVFPDIDECHPNPCRNGGTCRDVVNSYTCDCLTGFSGAHCEIDIDECQSNPCRNGGACRDSVNSYTCDCPPGFSGTHCEGCQSWRYGTDCSKCSYGCQNECDKSNGNCMCKKGWKNDMCTECSEGHYKDRGECTPCSEGCKTTCDSVTGHCQCRPGWTSTSHWEPKKCDTKCGSGKYGEDCKESCGRGCQGRYCNRETGHCTCRSEKWAAPKCEECQEGWYGGDCRTQCGKGCEGGRCDKANGKCTCRSVGWKEPRCDGCEDGYYGDQCAETCGLCAGNVPCDKTTGHCHGCQGSQQMPFCKADCKDGTYGNGCQGQCGQCAKGEHCDKNNGDCPACKPGWKPPLCQEKCDDHSYGHHCKGRCGHCKNKNVCDKTNGICPSGCEDGFDGPHCDKCSDRLWAPNCSLPCGQCAGDGSCDMDTGRCSSPSCLAGFTGPSCQTAAPPGSSVVVPAVIAVIILLLVIAGIILAVICIRQRRRKNSLKRDADVPLTDWPGNRDQDVENPQSHIHGNIHAQSDGRVAARVAEDADGDTTARANVGPMTPLTMMPTKSQAAAKATGTVAAAVAVKEDSEKAFEEEDVYTHEDLYASYSSVRSTGQLDAFQQKLLDCLAASEGLSVQFKNFRRGMLLDWNVGLRPENKEKNRFNGLGAYDENRVVLIRPKGDNGTDYINASYIKGINSARDYIAMQGPLETTTGDVWWMIWQENVSQIVMLTNLMENGKGKCAMYWPEMGKNITYGHVNVTSVSEDVRADFLIRTFSLRVKGTADTRLVHQYHFLSWPDHGVPAAGSLVDFWRFVTARASADVPTVVHCSAGVGRTGTYIALDIAISRKSRGQEVIVANIVKELREQRSILVQTEAQYKFLHEGILEAYSSQNTRLSFRHLDINFSSNINVWKSQSAMGREYKTLQQMKSWAKRKTDTAGLPENSKKNRDPNNPPDDSHLAYLTEYANGRNQYINAVFKSTLTQKLGVLLTQLPLPDTVVDLWRLVASCHICTIVSLGSKDENKTVQNYAQYWPQKKGKALSTGDYTITLSDTTPLQCGITSYSMTVKSEGKPWSVKVLHYTGWSGEEPDSISDVIHLVRIVRRAADSNPAAPVLVQCLDGATRSGLFCALYDLISRMMDDEEIDIFSPVRSVHQIRPNAVTEAQYCYCYKVAQQFKQSLSVYVNT
ncbi:uncharacterized protein LOC143285265 [Babylonia areolata]|uniref:uncharacterized protein LOC143285265 n=1 Tax=Babylonia areolata TaxID=304850 RepID=UPI003FD0691D